MSNDRRSFLVQSASLGAASLLAGCEGASSATDTDTELEPAPDREAEPSPWEPEQALDLAVFPWAPVVGDAAEGSAIVNLRAELETVVLTVMVALGDAWEEHGSAVVTLEEGYGTLTLDDLDADTAYSVVFSSDGVRSAVTRFRTALAADGFRKVVFGATSCLGDANPEWTSLVRASEAGLDFMLMLGDTVYADGSVSLADYRAEYEAALSNPALAALLGSTGIIATWDDHEVENNWVLGETVTQEQVDTARVAFREALAQETGPTGGIWRRLSCGTVAEIFVLDMRGERAEDRIVSEEQLTWLLEGLEASSATFKIVVTSVHLTDHTGGFGDIEAEDRWQGTPTQRDPLVAALDGLDGVLVVTGDMHYSALQWLGAAGAPGAEVLEVAAGPAGSRVINFTELLDGNPQYEAVLDTWTYARIELDPGLGTITVQLIGEDGEVLAAHTLG